jgi:hypothetical protein
MMAVPLGSPAPGTGTMTTMRRPIATMGMQYVRIAICMTTPSSRGTMRTRADSRSARPLPHA